MSKYDELLENIDKVENLAYSEYAFIFGLILTDELIIKNILREKNPSLTDKDLDEIVLDEEELNKRDDLEIENNESDPTRREVLKSERRNRIKIIKDIWRERIKNLKEDVKMMLIEIKKSIYDLIENSKQLSKKLVTSAVKIANSIPSIALIISAPPFNIPKALVDLGVIIALYLDIIYLLKMSVSLLNPIKRINLIFDKKTLNVISTFLNIYVKSVLAIWKPVTFLGNIIDKLIADIIEFFKNNKGRILRKATRRLRKLKYLPGRDLDAVNEDDLDEVEELLEKFLVNDKKAYDFKKSVEADLSDLSNKFEESKVDISKINPDLESSDSEDLSSFIYDVILPDGTTISSLSEDSVKYFKEKYSFKLVDIN
jgi:hypothetical protein